MIPSKPRPHMRGERSPNWRGGKTSSDQTERSRVEFRAWRVKVFELNKHKCNICGELKYLVAHHKKSFKDYPELRYRISNGIILCRKCHPSVHKYGILKFKKIYNYKPKQCLTCRKIFKVPFNRILTARFCSKPCWYNRPNKVTHAEHLEYKRKWYKEHKKNAFSNNNI